MFYGRFIYDPSGFSHFMDSVESSKLSSFMNSVEASIVVVVVVVVVVLFLILHPFAFPNFFVCQL